MVWPISLTTEQLNGACPKRDGRLHDRNRRHYAYKHIGPGEALELVREPANRSNDYAVAYCHRGVHLGYVPKGQRWIAEALDDGLRVAAFAEEVKIGWIFRRRAKFVGTRIVILNEEPAFW